MNTKGAPIFWLAMVLILGGVWFYQSYTPGNNIQWSRDFDAARRTAADMNRPMLLYFTASWCGPCKAMKRTVWPKPEVEAFVNNQTVPVYLDVDESDVKPVAARYTVNSIPTIVLTDADGNILPLPSGGPAMTNGLIDAAALIELIEKAKSPAAEAMSADLDQ